MPDTNFDLAPPPKTVDGLAAVPIDIQRVTATLSFDGQASSGVGDASIDFIVGPVDGCPIFDLRQTITAAWLDGAPVPIGELAAHDFGGGAGADLRVLERLLVAGSSHTLRLTYTLGTPQASTAGSYQPALTWSAGPRLAFNFGFTDLGPGRYLDSWIPANLIFDQFELTLELVILNTAIAHTPITNGTVTALGSNHWSVAFPARFTALSPLLELRASDTVLSQTGTVVLPISGVTVTIEAWKLASSAIDLGARITDISGWLTANEQSTGRYLHGTRFVAFLNQGGMEYEGGATSTVGNLRHETFHSWFGRGAKPASQDDGWWDEAWNVYNDLGGSGALPLDFTSAPVELSPRNPWSRITPGTSYSSGERLFEGLAAFAGVAPLRSQMAAFYTEHTQRPVTTVQLEELLLCRTGVEQVVDVFHRFAYGFADPSPAPDLWLKDDPGDPGSNQWAGTFWNSPDLWIRNQDDDSTVHQPVEAGQDNWFYARVRNRSTTGTARHFAVAFNVKPWAGIQFSYPQDFLPCIAASAGFELGPGETRIVKARWPRDLVPPAGMHACWLAAVLTRSDPPAGGSHVWESNNLAQKNLTVVDLAPDDWFILPFVLNRFVSRRPRRVVLQLLSKRREMKLDAVLLHSSEELFAKKAHRVEDLLGPAAERLRLEPPTDGDIDCGGGHRAQPARFLASIGTTLPVGPKTGTQLHLPTAGQIVMGLALRVPQQTKPGVTLHLDLLQREGQGARVTGGLAIEIRVGQKGKAHRR